MPEDVPLQPFLHDATVALRAPVQVWSRADGSLGGAAIDGVYVADIRVVRGLRVDIGGRPGEHVTTLDDAPDRVRFVSLHRHLDGLGADPDTRATLERRVHAGAVSHALRLESRVALDTEVRVTLVPDLSTMHVVKSGLPAAGAALDGDSWTDGEVVARLDAPGADRAVVDGAISLTWPVTLPAGGATEVAWTLAVEDRAATLETPPDPAPWTTPDTTGLDDRLRRWVDRALGDLDALRLRHRATGGEFIAAGAPWFLTLFGRDALWTARFLLPLGTALPLGTLRVLAGLQGTATSAETAEQPGKILHELRRGPLEIPGEGVTLPPVYFGTVDATPLWIRLLVDVWRDGVPAADLVDLRPALEAALAWMRDHGDSDGDHLLEYIDASGHGLANQGWKDSGDSIQWRDGRLARGPVALCEVQAYAFAAAQGGADLLDAWGGDGAPWRAWAADVQAAFRARYWVEDERGRYPAIALDVDKNPVDSLSSNLGHLLGTGLLDAEESRLVAERLVSPELSSGFGLRTLSTRSGGYWPLGYHIGSVWTHDTAIAIEGLAADGFAAEAAELSEGLLRASAAFDARLPELYSGDGLDAVPAPTPYPASCRPQAWSAAAAIPVLRALRA